MTIRVSRRRLLCISALGWSATAAGCLSLGDSTSESSAPQPDQTHLIYRTKTDRLSSSGASSLTAAIAGAPLPPCSIATVDVVAPHPSGRTDVALVRVITRPCDAEASPFPDRSWSTSLAGMLGEDEQPSTAPASAVLVDELPLWQLDAILASLDKAHFFDKRRTVLSPEVFLSVQNEKHAVGKRYRAVPELDALALRTMQHGYAARGPIGGSPRNQRAEISRLPSVDVR